VAYPHLGPKTLIHKVSSRAALARLARNSGTTARLAFPPHHVSDYQGWRAGTGSNMDSRANGLVHSYFRYFVSETTPEKPGGAGCWQCWGRTLAELRFFAVAFESADRSDDKGALRLSASTGGHCQKSAAVKSFTSGGTFPTAALFAPTGAQVGGTGPQ